MKTGFTLSLAFHIGLLLAALLRLPVSDADREVMQVTEVDIISAAEFDALRSSAPAAPALDLETMTQPLAPVEPVDTVTAPQPDQAPAQTEAAIVEAPQPRDSNPDTSGARVVVAQPDVVTDVGQPETAPDAPTPSIVVPQDQGRDATNSPPAVVAMATPPAPRPAPRIDTSDAPKPPRPVEAAPEPTPVVSEPVEEPVVETPPEEVPPEAPEEATTEITPEAPSGEPDSNALQRSIAPRARPGNFEATVAERDRQPEPAPDPAPVTQTPSPDPETETPAVDPLAAMIASAEREAAATPAPTAPAAALGPPMTAGEKDGLMLSIKRCWAVPAGLENDTDLVVTVAVELSPEGKIVGGAVRPVSPSQPEGSFKVAFDAARRALLRCQPYDLPDEKFGQWQYLEVEFNPQGVLSNW